MLFVLAVYVKVQLCGLDIGMDSAGNFLRKQGKISNKARQIIRSVKQVYV